MGRCPCHVVDEQNYWQIQQCPQKSCEKRKCIAGILNGDHPRQATEGTTPQAWKADPLEPRPVKRPEPKSDPMRSDLPRIPNYRDEEPDQHEVEDRFVEDEP